MLFQLSSGSEDGMLKRSTWLLLTKIRIESTPNKEALTKSGYRDGLWSLLSSGPWRRESQKSFENREKVKARRLDFSVKAKQSQ